MDSAETTGALSVRRKVLVNRLLRYIWRIEGITGGGGGTEGEGSVRINLAFRTASRRALIYGSYYHPVRPKVDFVAKPPINKIVRALRFSSFAPTIS